MNDNTPEFMSPALAIEAYNAAKGGERAVENLRTKQITLEADPDPPRSFLCPTQPNSKFLINAGTVKMAPYNPNNMGLQATMERIGDVWVKFSSGVCSTKDPAQIDWLLAHSGDPNVHNAYHTAKGSNPRDCSAPIGLCHEQGPGVDTWAELKLGQIATARRPQVISPEIDIDAFLRGDHLAKQPLKTGEGARMAATAGASENAARERADGQRNN